jgi:hypothetical protein
MSSIGGKKEYIDVEKQDAYMTDQRLIPDNPPSSTV